MTISAAIEGDTRTHQAYQQGVNKKIEKFEKTLTGLATTLNILKLVCVILSIVVVVVSITVGILLVSRSMKTICLSCTLSTN